jgi:TPR repeat protein
MAAALPDSPERADAAFLLLEYAAESGHPEAAFLVAGYYDPTDGAPSGTIRKNAQIAYDWYRSAAKGGEAEASQRLERLKAWVREKATQGAWESKQLLDN